MKNVWKIVKPFCIALCFALVISGCSRVNQSNFDKIKTEMSYEEVVAILGKPTSSNSVDIAGVSGTSATWKTSSIEIDIQFLNNKVFVKFLNQLNSSETPHVGEVENK